MPEDDWNCERVRALLSDLLDVRRGERPGPGASPLGDPETRAGVEGHVEGCAACAARLVQLEEVCRVYAEAPVASDPDYARLASVARAGAAVQAECARVRAWLGDLLDVRAGACPAPEASPLADSAVLAHAERHVAECAGCRAELAALEAVGAIFRGVGGALGAEPDFASWGQVARDRAKYGGYAAARRVESESEFVQAQALAAGGSTRSSLAPSPAGAPRSAAPGRWREFAAMSAASAAAALAVAALLPAWRGASASRRATAAILASAGVSEGWRAPERLFDPGPLPAVAVQASEPNPREVLPEGETRFQMLDRGEPVAMTFNLSAPRVKPLEQELNKRGSLLLSECPTAEGVRGGLLGAQYRVVPPEQVVAEDPRGLAVSAIFRGSPADMVGLRGGDYIVGVNDMHFAGGDYGEVLKFINVLNRLGKGETVALDVARQFGKHWVIKRRFVRLGVYEH